MIRARSAVNVVQHAKAQGVSAGAIELPTPEELTSFLAQLNLRKFRLRPDQFATAQLVLLAAHAEGVSAERLASRLAMVLAGPRREEFLQYFRAWRDIPVTPIQLAPPIDGGTGGPGVENQIRFAWIGIVIVVGTPLLWLVSLLGGGNPSEQILQVSELWYPLRKAALVLFPLIPPIVWLLLRLRTRTLWLKCTGRDTLNADPRAAPVPSIDLFAEPDFDAAAQALARYSDGPDNEIDLRATIEATARAVGLITPVWRSKRQASEYLVLIERQSQYDHLAALADILTDRLSEKGVRIHRYYFFGDPRVVRDDSPQKQEVLLEEIGAHFRFLPILVFATPAEFMDPLSGEPLPRVMDAFDAWDRRILLNFRPVVVWSDCEERLVRAGFSLVSASTLGIVALASSSFPRFYACPAMLEPPLRRSLSAQ